MVHLATFWFGCLMRCRCVTPEVVVPGWQDGIRKRRPAWKDCPSLTFSVDCCWRLGPCSWPPPVWRTAPPVSVVDVCCSRSDADHLETPPAPRLVVLWSGLFGVDGGQLVTNWLVPVSSFGLSGPMRISEEKKIFVSFRSVSFIYVNTYSS